MPSTLFDLVTKLSQSQENVVGGQLAVEFASVSEFLLAQTEIRIFIANSQNFGHQSSSVNILRNLINLGCTAKFPIALYADSQEDFDDLVAKIKMLIPQFKTLDTPFKLGACDVTATKLTAGTFPVKIPLAITGGFDSNEYKDPPLDLLNTANYLQLQPYAWSRGANLVWQDGIANRKKIDLDSRYPGMYLSRRAFYLPVPEVTASDWAAIADSPYKEKGKIVKYLLDTSVASINLCPVYGITTKDRGTPYSSLYNIIAGIIAAQNAHWEAQIPTVIPLIAGLSDADWNVFQDLINDPAELKSRGGGWLSHKTIAVTADFIQWHKAQKVGELVVLSGGPGIVLTAEEVEAASRNLKSNQILVVYLGAIPGVLFNQLYAQATLPGVFEGQNTAELMLNLGRSYFKLNTNLGTFYDYPTLPLAADTPDANANKCMLESYNGIYLSLPTNWKSDAPTYPPLRLLPIISAYLEPKDNPTALYFKNLGTFFHDQKEDKLLLGLDLLVNYVTVAPVRSLDRPQDTPMAVRTMEGNELELLYERLQNNITKGVLQLLTAIPTGIIYDFFSGVVGDTLFTITDAAVTINEDKTQVALTGSTLALMGSAAVNFVFTMAEGKINTLLEADFSSTTVTFPGAEWFTFSAPKLLLELNEGKVVPAAVTIAIDLTIGITLNIALTIPSENDTVLVKAIFTDNEVSLSELFQLVGGINLSAYLPSQIQLIADIEAKQVEFKYNYKTNTLSYIGINFGTPQGSSWNLVPGVVVTGLQLGAQVTDPANMATRATAYQMHGEFNIADATVGIDAFYPQLRVSGGLKDDSKPLSIATLIETYLGSAFTQALPGFIKDIQITDLNFLLNQPTGSYSFGMSVDTPWPITIAGATPFTITGLGFTIDAESKQIDPAQAGTQPATTTDITGSFTGTVVVLPNSQNVTLTATASYLGSEEGWTYEARQTAGIFSVSALLQEYLQWSTSLDITIDGLSIKIATLSGAWEFNGKTAKPWVTPLGDYSGTAKVGYTGTAVTPAGHYGAINANIKWNNIDLTLFYNFDPTFQAFGITWGILTGQIEEKMIAGKKHQIATLAFNQSTTIGSIVETMVSWATGSSFGLAAPWNILNSIPLNDLSLVYDFTDSTVGFKVDIGPINLGFVTINGIVISYNSNDPDPAKNGVIVKLDASGAWGDVPEWNAAKPETTPAPPGQGNKYLDLRLLALGQHVTLDCFKTADNVQAAIACMSGLPDPQPGEIPLVRLDSNSSWLVGMDFGVLKLETKKTNAIALAAAAPGYFLTLQIVFNDPNLYALRIALEGEPAKIFKGLDFQIMYKKISDSVGVYQAEIVLPDVMRKINMGQFNITLPVFGIAVYTNGDFQVDIGFPWKEDFSRSFTFQTLIWTPVGIPIPVMGSVGVYFGKLSSATTNKVPAATNGTFNPVLVFGFGIQFGFGYSFDAGILKAGFSLTAVAILEGVLAKWNPYQITDGSGNNTQLETSYYFWFRGTVGIIGKLYGSVDFAIVKAELNIDIRLLVQMTFAPYEPIELSVTASVSVSLKVSINLGLFKISISFSFSARIQQTITINAIGGTPPWNTQTLLLVFGTPALQRRKRKLYYDRATLLEAYSVTNPVWSNLEKAATPAPLTAYAGMGLTVAGDDARQLSEQLPCYIAMLFIASVPPPQEDKENGKRKAYGNTPDTSFEVLSKQVFRWAIASIQPGPVSSGEVDETIVTDLQLAALLDYLGNPANPTPISSAAVNAFMADQFILTVSAPSSGEADATYFPVPPEMVLTLPDYGMDYKGISYSFQEYNSTSSGYTVFLKDYFDELAVQVDRDEQRNKPRSYALEDTNDISMGSFIFGDYFLLLCRQMLQSARDSLKDFKYYLQDAQSINDIVNWVNAHSGTEQYTMEMLFADNVSAALNTDKILRINGSNYIVQAVDTFDNIAGQSIFNNGFTGNLLATVNQGNANTLQAGVPVAYPGKDPYKTLPGQSLNDVALAIGVSAADLISKGNILALPGLLLPVATLSLPTFDSKTAPGDTLNKVAATYNITQQQLAAPAENGDVIDLFDKNTAVYLNIANLQQFTVGDLLNEIQATNGLQHLSGMTSRYYMAGLRLPTKGITPAFKGMWVTENGGVLSLPDYAGLYALTGQQFPLPALTNSDHFNIQFSRPPGLGWLAFANSDPSQLPLPLIPGSTSAQQIVAVAAFATTNSLDIPLSALGSQDAFITKAATYPFTSQINWNSASPFTMPYGGNAGGVPALSLWQIPDTLLQLPDAQTRAVNPRVKIQVGRFDESSRSMVNTPVTYYGYGSLAAFTVKRVPPIAESPATLTTYEIMGADGANAALLEKMVSGIGNDKAAIATLTFAYPVDSNGTTTEGIQTDALDGLTIGIAQVNLSTETRPDSLSEASFPMTEAQEQVTLLNEAPDIIRLLWQASITRGGGYYLYYFNSGSNTGLPDRIFNDKNEATLSLLVLYTAPQDEAARNNLTPYMNVVSTGEAIDTTHSVLFAEADPFLRSIPADQTETLGTLAYGYYGNAADIAADNQDLLLRTGTALTVGEGVYEVRPAGIAPAGDLAAIAVYFGTTPDAIKAVNPLQTNWPDPLPLYTALYLPPVTVTIGTGNGGNTLGLLSTYYGESLAALAAENLDVPGIFADGQPIILKGGPDIRSSSVPPGVAGIEAVRPVPPEIPADPSAPDYGRTFLLNTYNLLSYQVAENNYFTTSNLGLPASPSAETDDGGTSDKVNYPKALSAEDNWNYAQSIPYSRFAKNIPQTAANMPSPAGSPYRGLGDLLQIDFAWQDLYGNRIITTLAQPSGKSQLNMPPLLTGYTDPLIGLNQWPSVSSCWECKTGGDNTPQLQLTLSFGDSPYQGLLWAKATGADTITCRFTEPLEDTSAVDPANYSLDNKIGILHIALGQDQQTVTLQVDNVPENLLITVSINNISNASKTESYTGSAQFSYPEIPEEATSTIIAQAAKDKQVYAQVWYQLTDLNGISYTVDTSLLQDGYTLTPSQVQDLVQKWIGDIYLFLENRAQGLTDVPAPSAAHLLTFTIDPARLNETQIFRLNLSFTIKRSRNLVAADLETTGGILQATTQVAALTESTESGTHSLDTFTSRFEAALLQPGKYSLRIATGTDREDAANSKEIWVTRLGLDTAALTPISYRITDAESPDMFAPRPISNKLESRRQVPLYYYSEKTGINFTTPSAYVDFTGVDMDKWGLQFFSSIDDVLSPEFTAAIQLVDNKKSTGYLETLLANKKNLAEIVKEWMIPLFEGETADAAGAKEAFRQLLLENLGNAYTVQAAVQFHAQVSADAVTGIAPRLYGSINRNFKFTDAMVDENDNTIAYLFFTNPPDQAAATVNSNFTLSDGLVVTKSGTDPLDTRRVILQLSGKATAGSTQVTLSGNFTDMTGNRILPPLIRITAASVNEANNSDSITFTSPKLPLQTDAAAVLPFLINSPQIVRGSGNELLPYVDLDLNFAGSAIEHQIGQLPNIEGYEASTWLSFVTPSKNDSPLRKDLGKIQVPIVLREFPTAPAMVNQSGQPVARQNASTSQQGASIARQGASVSLQDTTDISQLLGWNYAIQYSLPIHYPQDQLNFTVNFNVTDTGNRLLAKGVEDAFPELAEFIMVSGSVYSVLQTQLTKVTAETADNDPLLDTVSTALKSYNDMVSRIITAAEDNALAMHASPSRLGSNQVSPYTFYIQEGSATVDEVQALIISVHGVPPEGIGNPTVDITGYDRQVYGQPCTGDFCYYYTQAGVVLPASGGQTIQERTVVLPAMNILARQDAATTALLKRNARLIPEKPCNEPFVYTTGTVEFSNPYHPTTDWQAEVDISTINAPAGQHNYASLNTQLTNLFDALLLENSQDTLTFLMSCQYTYQLNPALGDISLPVMMQPMQEIQVKPGVTTDYTKLADMIGAWSGSIGLWYNTVNPDTTGASLRFDLTILSNLTQQPLPLLRLRSLVLGVQYIIIVP